MTKRKTNEEFIKELKRINPDILPLGVYIKAQEPVHCKCLKCGYDDWYPIPNNILRGQGCPSCAGNIKKTTEAFAKEVEAINPNVTITGEYIDNKTPVKFICKLCGKEDKSVPSSLLNGHGCKDCGHKVTAQKHRKTNEEFLKELSEKNPGIIPLEAYKGTDVKILCKCTCGNTWKVTPSNLLQGKKCKKCVNGRMRKAHNVTKFPMSHDEFALRVYKENPNVELIEEYKGYDVKIRIRCKDCGYEQPIWPQQLLRGQGCKRCSKMWSTSFPEQAIYYYLKKVFPDAINTYIVSGKIDLDIYLPSIKKGIEYDGRHWHKDKEEIERRKYNKCNEKNIFLIRVRELKANIRKKAADKIIDSKYGDDKTFKSLDECITKVMNYLGVQGDVNTKRDQILIREQYYGKIKGKSLGTKYPALVDEWYQPLNGKITPFMVLPKCNDSYYWKCPKCENIYPAAVSARTAGHGCAKCAGVAKKTHEQFIDEIALINPDIVITGEYFNANTNIDYFCKKCEKPGSARPADLLKGKGCKYCAIERSRKSKTMPEEVFLERANQLNPDIDVIGKYINSKERILCKCKKCGNELNPYAGSLVHNKTGCPVCSGRRPKKVLCIEKNIVYESINQAERMTGITHSTISKCCNGKGSTAGGCHWQFV